MGQSHERPGNWVNQSSQEIIWECEKWWVPYRIWWCIDKVPKLLMTIIYRMSCSLEVTPSSQKMVDKLIHQMRMSQHLGSGCCCLPQLCSPGSVNAFFLLFSPLDLLSSPPLPPSLLTPQLGAPDHTLYIITGLGKQTNKQALVMATRGSS